MVHLVYHQVGGRQCQWTLIAAPPFGVGICHVYDGGALAVYSHCFGKHTGCFGHGLLARLHLEGIELAFQVALDVGSPEVAACALHLHCLNALSSRGLCINMHFDTLSL